MKLYITGSLFCCAFIAMTALSFSTGVFSIILAFVGFAIVGGILAWRGVSGSLPIFTTVYSANVIIACAIFIVYLVSYGNPYYLGGSDDLNYEDLAEDVVQNTQFWQYSGIRGNIVESDYNSVGYVYIVSLLYRLGEVAGGFHTMLPRLFNAMLLGWISILTYVLACRNGLDPFLGRNTALLVGLLPVMTFTAAHTFRDVLISLLCIWIVYLWDKRVYISSKSSMIGLWIWSIIVFMALWELRQMQGVALISFCLLCYLMIHTRPTEFGILTAVVCILLLVLVLDKDIWLMISDWLTSRSSFYTEYYTESKLDSGPGLSSIIFSTHGPKGILLRCIYGLISPIPFIGLRFEEQFQGSGTLIHYMFLPFLGLGLFEIVRRRKAIHLLLAFLLFFSMTLVTFTFRHAVVFFPYAALITALGYAGYHAYKTIIWGTTGIGCVAMGILYVLMKGGI